MFIVYYFILDIISKNEFFFLHTFFNLDIPVLFQKVLSVVACTTVNLLKKSLSI